MRKGMEGNRHVEEREAGCGCGCSKRNPVKHRGL